MEAKVAANLDNVSESGSVKTRTLFSEDRMQNTEFEYDPTDRYFSMYFIKCNKCLSKIKSICLRFIITRRMANWRDS